MEALLVTGCLVVLALYTIAIVILADRVGRVETRVRKIEQRNNMMTGDHR